VTCPGYQNETWNTYITETFDPLSRHPLFWSATLNDPTQSTWYGGTPSETGIIGQPGATIGAEAGNPGALTLGSIKIDDRVDYFGMATAMDGTPWIGFAQECPFGLPVAGNPNCDQAAGEANDGLWGMVGRLVRIHGEADEDNDQ
jgi:hypothetical protein